MVTVTPLHNDFKSKDFKNSFIGKFVEILEKNHIDYKYLEYYNQPEFWDTINKSKLFISRCRGTEKDLSLIFSLLPEIERLGVLALPSFKTVYHCGDKLKLPAFYDANKINSPKTFLFWEKEILQKSLNKGEIKFPVVVKLRRGAN